MGTTSQTARSTESPKPTFVHEWSASRPRPHRESPPVLIGLLERLESIAALGFADWPPLAEIHPAARRLLAG